MNNSSRNRPDQEDLDRARRIMEDIETGSSADSGDDSLLYYLDAYKKKASLRHDASPSDAAWKQISETIEATDRSEKSTREFIPSAFWKIAAIFLAAAGLVLAYMIIQPSEPALIAESGAVQQVTELADGSIVTLRPNSQLYELESSDDRQIYRIDGEAFFDVAENRDRLFTAISGDAKVVVTGTKFTLSNWSSGVRVYLESGSVTFSSLDDSESVNLQPGEFSEQIGNRITVPATIGEQSYTGWLTDELRLNSRTVSDVVAEIEHHFNIRLKIPDSVADERLTGSLQLEDREQVLSDLALSLNGRFVRLDDNLYQFEPTP